MVGGNKFLSVELKTDLTQMQPFVASLLSYVR